MILPVFFQGGLFIGAAAAGFILAFFYDLFRVARRIIPHSGFLIHVEDILYWVVVVAVMFYFLLTSNSGEIRLFTIVGTFIGMIAYFKLLSPLFLKVSLTIFEAVKRVVLTSIKIIAAPFIALFRILAIPASIAANKAIGVYDYERKVYRKIKTRGRQKVRKLKNNFNIIFKKI